MKECVLSKVKFHLVEIFGIERTFPTEVGNLHFQLHQKIARYTSIEIQNVLIKNVHSFCWEALGRTFLEAG